MKIPYPMTAAVDNHKRHAQMAVALQYDWPRLQQTPIDDSRTLTIAAYGPSLIDTWHTMKHPIMSMSGATKWLAERGVIADYHVDMDPRPNKVDDVTPTVPGVHYLMATVCHPAVFKRLKEDGAQVTLWHCYSAEETYEIVRSIDPGELVIRGGSTIGLTALHVGGVMGYRHFEIHGMDGSFRDLYRTMRHAGPHTGTKQNKDGITWDAGGKTYATSRIMSNAVAETINAMANFPIFCVFHGEGLTQALIREKQLMNACCADEERADRVRHLTAHILDRLTPAHNETVGSKAWDILCGDIEPYRREMAVVRESTEHNRRHAKFNTGTITLEQMMQLRGLTRTHPQAVIAEIGTFIGNSAHAMECNRLYTCDRDNDCFPYMTGMNWTTFPYKESTEMFCYLVEGHTKVNLFFVDGRIQLPDLPLILRLSTPDTMYLLDDYEGTKKGVANAKLLLNILPKHYVLIEPDPRLAGKSTLAAIVPARVFE